MVRLHWGLNEMAYDRLDDAVFEVAHSVRVVAQALGDRALPPHMVEEELTRISMVADRASERDHGFDRPSADVVGISADYVNGRIDHRTAASNLMHVLKDVRELYSSKISYEGVVLADRDETMRRDLHLPGEKVSIAVKDDGSPAIPSSEGLGDAPLTVSGTFVRGSYVDVDDHMPVLIHHAEYEFEGREGRHDASLFHAEKGEEHAYGVIMVRDDRMFLTPIARVGTYEDGHSELAGPTREILGDGGRSSFGHVDPAGFEGLKERLVPDGPQVAHRDLEKGPIAGEFTFDTAAKGDSTGPLRISGIGWSASPDKDELALVTSAVDAFVASERAQDPSLYKEGTFAFDVRDANRRAPYGLAEVEDAVYVTHSIGRGSIDDPRVAKAMDALVHDPAILGSMLRDAGSTESNLRIVVAVADAPGFVVGASLMPDGMVKWEGVDVMSGEVIPRNANDRAAGVLESVAAAQAVKGSSSARGSILSQASGLSLAPSPVAAKGMGAQETPAAVLAAAVSKGDRGR
jgi:hypothetical protein